MKAFSLPLHKQQITNFRDRYVTCSVEKGDKKITYMKFNLSCNEFTNHKTFIQYVRARARAFWRKYRDCVIFTRCFLILQN